MMFFFNRAIFTFFDHGQVKSVRILKTLCKRVNSVRLWMEELHTIYIMRTLVNFNQNVRDNWVVRTSRSEFSLSTVSIGTVIGLVVILANLTDPSKIGPGLAVALITTLYGALAANMVFMPIGAKLKYRADEES